MPQRAPRFPARPERFVPWRRTLRRAPAPPGAAMPRPRPRPPTRPRPRAQKRGPTPPRAALRAAPAPRPPPRAASRAPSSRRPTQRVRRRSTRQLGQSTMLHRLWQSMLHGQSTTRSAPSFPQPATPRPRAGPRTARRRPGAARLVPTIFPATKLKPPSRRPTRLVRPQYSFRSARAPAPPARRRPEAAPAAENCARRWLPLLRALPRRLPSAPSRRRGPRRGRIRFQRTHIRSLKTPPRPPTRPPRGGQRPPRVSWPAPPSPRAWPPRRAALMRPPRLARETPRARPPSTIPSPRRFAAPARPRPRGARRVSTPRRGGPRGRFS
mmetsp:Transcript_16009/g.56921  ORF Transcript_16009/g.56921 Transcript_16009/m.56921 type:complete len:325 (+) Transcript_16009:653-1627(+)